MQKMIFFHPVSNEDQKHKSLDRMLFNQTKQDSMQVFKGSSSSGLSGTSPDGEETSAGAFRSAGQTSALTDQG